MNNRRIKSSFQDKVFILFNSLFLLLIVAIVLYPLWYCLICSISNPQRVIAGDVKLLPAGFDLSGYIKVFQNSKVLTGYKNTICYLLLGVPVNTILVILTAYPLSRKELWGRKVLTVLFTFTMYFQAGLIPQYLLVKKLGLMDTVWALILPFAINMWNVIIVRSFFETGIPEELQEAAAIDGCSHFRTLLQIVLPLAKSVLSVILLYHAVDYWNQYFHAMIYFSSEEKYPLQLILRQILLTSANAANGIGAGNGALEQMFYAESIKYALIVIASVPILVVYPFLQKSFEKGIMIGSVKG